MFQNAQVFTYVHYSGDYPPAVVVRSYSNHPTWNKCRSPDQVVRLNSNRYGSLRDRIASSCLGTAVSIWTQNRNSRFEMGLLGVDAQFWCEFYLPIAVSSATESILSMTHAFTFGDTWCTVCHFDYSFVQTETFAGFYRTFYIFAGKNDL